MYMIHLHVFTSFRRRIHVHVLHPLDGEFRKTIITKNVQISKNSYLFAFY